MDYLDRALEYRSNLFVARERLKFIRDFWKSRTDKTTIVKGEKAIVPREKIQEVDLQLFRNNMKIPCGIQCKYPLGESPLHCAECKNLVRKPITTLPILESIKDVHAVGIYRYKGDEKAQPGIHAPDTAIQDREC